MSRVKDESVNANRDTVYVMGDPRNSDSFTQSQLNNNMSGTDANAIYAATHNPYDRGTYTDPNPVMGFDNGAQYNEWLRDQGLKPYTGAMTASPMIQGNLYPYAAYVAGAGAQYDPRLDQTLPMGLGTTEGMPVEWLQGAKQNGYSDYATILSQILADPNTQQAINKYQALQ